MQTAALDDHAAAPSFCGRDRFACAHRRRRSRATRIRRRSARGTSQLVTICSPSDIRDSLESAFVSPVQTVNQKTLQNIRAALRVCEDENKASFFFCFKIIATARPIKMSKTLRFFAVNMAIQTVSTLTSSRAILSKHFGLNASDFCK